MIFITAKTVSLISDCHVCTARLKLKSIAIASNLEKVIQREGKPDKTIWDIKKVTVKMYAEAYNLEVADVMNAIALKTKQLGKKPINHNE